MLSPQHDCPLSRNHPSWSFKDTRIPQTPPAEITQVLANPAALRRDPKARLHSQQTDKHQPLPEGPGATISALPLSMK